MATPLGSTPGPRVIGKSGSAVGPNNLPAFRAKAGPRQKADSLPWMADSTNSNNKHAAGLLNSWKQISAYLNRGVRTVQRWERTLGLPVHRIRSGNRAPVFAFDHELEQWLRDKAGIGGMNAGVPTRTPGATLNARQESLLRFTGELRLRLFELERDVRAQNCATSTSISEALLAIQKTVSSAVAENLGAPVEAGPGKASRFRARVTLNL
jgi:hypothetical protein